MTVRLKDTLNRGAIIPELRGASRDEVLRELVDVVAKDVGQDREKLFTILKEREEQSPTAIKFGIAIPHGRVNGLERICMGFGRSIGGIKFGAPDGKPTHIFFLIFAPQNSAGEHLKVLARIARLCRDPSLREKLLEADSGNEIYNILMDGENKL